MEAIILAPITGSPNKTVVASVSDPEILSHWPLSSSTMLKVRMHWTFEMEWIHRQLPRNKTLIPEALAHTEDEEYIVRLR